MCDCVSKGKGRVQSCRCAAPRVIALQKLFFLFIVSFFILIELVWFGLVGI
jgi:hypothetical protein